MKKFMLLLIIPILLCGCQKKENAGDENKTTTSSTTTTSTTSTTTSTTTTTKSKKTTTRPTRDMTTIKAEENHIYKSVKTGIEHKYSYIYNDEATCRKRADADAFNTVNKVHPYVVFGCEEVQAKNGNKYWGAFFYEQADEDSIFYY